MSWRWYSAIVLVPMTLVTIFATVRPLQWLEMVPDPMATHFDAAGNPDGFSSPATNIALITGMNTVVIIAIAIALRFRFLTGINGRILTGSAAFTIVLLSVILLELFKSQSTLTDAADAHFPMSIMVMAFGFATVVGSSMALVPPPAPQKKPANIAEPSHAVAEPEEYEWRSVETLHPGIQLIFAITLIAMVGIALLTPGWISIGAGIIVAVMILATWGWRLRIDPQGFHYSGFLGFPRAVIPHAAIASVESKDLRPGEWGGWGWRLSGAGTGLITRAGSGLRITRTNGRILEVSIQDAATSANLLTYYGHHDSGDAAKHLER